METGITSKYEPLKRACNRSSAGISVRHGPHHVAQILANRTLPLKSASLRACPSASSKVISATGTGLSTKIKFFGGSCAEARRNVATNVAHNHVAMPRVKAPLL